MTATSWHGIMADIPCPLSQSKKMELHYPIIQLLIIYSPIYTAENFRHGSDESGTRTKKIVLITHLHILFSTVPNDVQL